MRISDWSSDVCSSDLHCAFGNLPKCANDLWMSAMADEHDVPSGFHLPLGLTMHLGHERAGGVQIGKTPRLSCGRHGLGHAVGRKDNRHARSEEHTSELQSLMRITYAVFSLKKKTYI